MPIHCFYNTLCNNWKLAVLIWCGKSEIAAKIKIMMTKKWIFNAVNGLKLGLGKALLLKISSFTRNKDCTCKIPQKHKMSQLEPHSYGLIIRLVESLDSI